MRTVTKEKSRGKGSRTPLDSDEKKRRKMESFKRAISKSRHVAKAQEFLRFDVRIKRELRRVVKYYYRHSHELQGPIFFVLWLAWLLVGSLFFAYAPKSQLGLMKGFYMALNIGYSIGFGYPSEESNQYLYFSTFYVLIGASFVGMALTFFAEKISKDNENWFTKMEHKQEIEKTMRAKESRITGTIQAYVHHCASALKALAVWLIVVVCMIVYSMVLFDWPFREAQVRLGIPNCAKSVMYAKLGDIHAVLCNFISQHWRTLGK